jgi:sRNA-binding carbon storage regulator CsrA
MMLKLERKVGEQIYIYPKEGTEHMTVEEFFAGGQICVELSKVRGSKAQIGIDANENLEILREELS